MGKVDRLRREMNLLLPCFGLPAMYLPTPDPTRRPGITPPLNTKHVLIYGEGWFNSQWRRAGPSPFSYLGMLFIYAMLQTGLCVKFSRNVDRVERGESDTRSARRFSMADYPCGGSGLHNVRMMQNPDKTKKPDPQPR